MPRGSAPGERRGGRQKGTPNKVTGLARDAIKHAADKLGGVDRMVAWAREDPLNERAFWTQIYPKLVPLQVAGDPDNPLETIRTVEHVIVPATEYVGEAADTDTADIRTAH